MKASELRLGIWVYLFGNAVQLTRDHLMYLLQKDGLPEPITLTEEWLVKFGFDLRDEYWMEKIQTIAPNVKRSVYISLIEGVGYIGALIPDPNKDQYIGIAEIRYVHQLQNLYFAMTGEELTIKE